MSREAASRMNFGKFGSMLARLALTAAIAFVVYMMIFGNIW